MPGELEMGSQVAGAGQLVDLGSGVGGAAVSAGQPPVGQVVTVVTSMLAQLSYSPTLNPIYLWHERACLILQNPEEF